MLKLVNTLNYKMNEAPEEEEVVPIRSPAEQAKPILTYASATPILLLLWVMFGACAMTSHFIHDTRSEVVSDYTQCYSVENPNIPCWMQVNQSNGDWSGPPCTCRLSINLPFAMTGQVFMYYGLTNFLQSHYRYRDSEDELQLRGSLHTKLAPKCHPFAYVHDKNNKLQPIMPCGALANSLFNDSFTLLHPNGSVVPVLRTGIAWPSDKGTRFRNPYDANGRLKLSQLFSGFAKPPNWRKNIWELDPDNPTNNGLENEDLMVWMRTASYPSFRKLYRRLDLSKQGYQDGLLAGNYTLLLEYNYPVTSFGGTKSFILSDTSPLGTKNQAQSVVYAVFSGLSLIFAVTFALIRSKNSCRLCKVN